MDIFHADPQAFNNGYKYHQMKVRVGEKEGWETKEEKNKGMREII